MVCDSAIDYVALYVHRKYKKIYHGSYFNAVTFSNFREIPSNTLNQYDDFPVDLLPTDKIYLKGKVNKRFWIQENTNSVGS